MLSVTKLRAVMLNVIMLSVMVPFYAIAEAGACSYRDYEATFIL